MILTSPNDILIDFGAIKIYYYGVIMAIAIVLSLLTINFICRKFYTKNDFEISYNLALGTIFFGFLGARIYYVIMSFSYFKNHLNEIFAIQNGGMSIHGAILGGLIFAISYLTVKKLPVLKYLDILSFGTIVGQIVGRWGNFFNSEAFGLPTNSFLKLYIPVEKRPEQYIDFEYFHPTFLYESCFNILVLIILLFILKKSKIDGFVFFSYITLYSIVRFFIEAIRTDSVLNINGIHIAEIVCVIGLIIGVSGILILKQKSLKYCTNHKHFVK